MPSASTTQAPAQLTISGLPAGWAVRIGSSPALRSGSNDTVPQFLAFSGRVTVSATKDYETRDALLQIGPGNNVVAWSEFYGTAKKAGASSKNAIAAVAVATTMAGVVYLARR